MNEQNTDYVLIISNGAACERHGNWTALHLGFKSSLTNQTRCWIRKNGRPTDTTNIYTNVRRVVRVVSNHQLLGRGGWPLAMISRLWEKEFRILKVLWILWWRWYHFSVGRLIGCEVSAYDPALAQLIPPHHFQHGLQCLKARLL